MATIATPVLRHVRKVITFNGATVDVPITAFAITGRVRVVGFTAYVDTDVVFDGACDSVRIALADSDIQLASSVAQSLSSGDWLNPTGLANVEIGTGIVQAGIGADLLLPIIDNTNGQNFSLTPFALSEDIVVTPKFLD